MDDFLGDSPHVMEWRVEGLLSEDQHESLPHLELSQRGHGEENEEAVEDCFWNHINGFRDEHDGETY